MAIGRISGPMLKADLLREGVDLAFETDLLYLDVNNNRVGINKSDPEFDLDVNGTTRIPSIEITGIADIGDITISGNNIDSNTGVLELGTGDTVVYQKKISIDDLEIEDNVIRSITPDTDIEFRPDDGGKVQIYSDTNVFGDILVTGNITAEGNIVIGDDQLEDTVIFNAKFASDLIPTQTGTFDLGSSTKTWKDVYVTNFFATNVVVDDLVVNDIDLRLRQGNIFYVATNGDDSFSGTHQNDPFATIEKALSEAVDGDTVYIYPGIYEETFPLTVPAGVTVTGKSLRSVTIIPDTSSQFEDVFLLNGETTIENLTVKNFFYNAINNTGHAFRFAPGCKVTKRSPYIRNVSVITQGTVTSSGDPRGYGSSDAGRGAFLDGAVVDPTSSEAGCLFHAVTFITPGVDAVTFTNGVRVEWLNCFTYFANRSVYCIDGVDGKYGAGRTALRISGLVGNVTVGETIEYYDTDGITLLESAVIDQVDTDGKLFVSGKADGFETAQERGGKQIVAFGNAQITNTQQKFGNGSLALDGVAGSYAFVQSTPDFGFGTGDFTVEGWVYRNTTGIQQNIFDFRTTTPQSVPLLGFSNAGVLFYNVNGSSVIVGSTAAAINQWNHIAVSRSGTQTKIFLNGVQQGSTFTDTTNYIQAPLYIGARFDGLFNLNGFIDDVRVIKGTAVYTANFTPPIVRSPVTLQTVLMARFDGTEGSTDFVDDAVFDQDIRFTNGATANRFTLTDFTDFGAEVRIIGSASVYGEFGLVGQGPGVIVYAIGHNLAYIGNGKETTNDPNTVVQANEVVEIDRAKIRYSSIDHRGDFRVGDLFFVNQETGTISFTAANFNVDASTSFTFTDGANTTFIDGSEISTGNLKISGNTIESLTGDVNFFAASDKINLQNNVEIDGDLTVNFNFTVDGNSTLGNSSSDTVEFNAFVSSSIIPSPTVTYDLGSITNQWQTVYAGQILVDDIEINNNFIRTNTTNTDLELIANGTGSVVIDDIEITDNAISSTTGSLNFFSAVDQINLQNNVEVNGNLTVNENFTVNGNSTLGNSSSDTVEFNAFVSSSIIPSPTVTYDLGSITNQWQTVYAGQILVDDIEINNNFIRTNTTNTDLELIANGTGSVVIDDIEITDNAISSTTGSLNFFSAVDQINLQNNVEVNGNLTVNENFTVNGNSTLGNSSSDTVEFNAFVSSSIIPSPTVTYDLGSITNQWQTVYAGQILVDDIEINNNFIRTNTTNTDLELIANGTGSVVIDDIEITDAVISTTGNLEIVPGSGIVRIDGTGSLVLPKGTTAERPTPENGQIRFNTSLDIFEGYDGTDWIQLHGVIDQDRDTKVTAELTQGANDNIIRFDVQNQTIVDIDSDRLRANRIVVDDIEIDNNQIRTVTPNTDLRLSAPGTGRVRFENFAIKNNVITNVINNSITVFDNTNNGYVKIDGFRGVVIPVGTNLQRPSVAFREAGMIRFNTDDQRIELFNGTTWGSVAGPQAGITQAQAQDIAVEIVLMLG
jgi:hypothetical protein